MHTEINKHAASHAAKNIKTIDWQYLCSEPQRASVNPDNRRPHGERGRKREEEGRRGKREEEGRRGKRREEEGSRGRKREEEGRRGRKREEGLPTVRE